jgi:hypothetical protein
VEFTVLQLVLHRMISAAVTLCMAFAFNFPTANPATAAAPFGQDSAPSAQLQGLRSVLFAGEHQAAAFAAGTQSGSTTSGADLRLEAGRHLVLGI